MFFIEKTALDAPEKLQTSININKPASRVCFFSKAIKPVTGCKRFQCALKCNRLQISYSTWYLKMFTSCTNKSGWFQDIVLVILSINFD